MRESRCAQNDQEGRAAAVQQSPALAKNRDGAIDGFGDFQTTNCYVNQLLRCLREYLPSRPLNQIWKTNNERSQSEAVGCSY